MRLVMGCALVLGGVMATGTMPGQTNGAGGAVGGAVNGAGQGVGSAASSAANATSSVAGDTGVGAPVLSDKAFVSKAISGNYNEIDASKMALQKSQNDQVKQYAQRMIDDHGKMLDSLHALAGQENVKFKDEPTSDGKKMAKKLDGLSGPEFDKAYVNGMVKDHKEDVQDFTAEINTGKDQPTKEAAQKNLPVIQEHLQMIQAIQKSMKS